MSASSQAAGANNLARTITVTTAATLCGWAKINAYDKTVGGEICALELPSGVAYRGVFLQQDAAGPGTGDFYNFSWFNQISGGSGATANVLSTAGVWTFVAIVISGTTNAVADFYLGAETGALTHLTLTTDFSAAVLTRGIIASDFFGNDSNTSYRGWRLWLAALNSTELTSERDSQTFAAVRSSNLDSDIRIVNGTSPETATSGGNWTRTGTFADDASNPFATQTAAGRMRREEAEPEERIRRRFITPPSGAVAPVDQPPRVRTIARSDEQPEERIPAARKFTSAAASVVDAPPPRVATRRIDEEHEERLRYRRAGRISSVDDPVLGIWLPPDEQPDEPRIPQPRTLVQAGAPVVPYLPPVDARSLDDARIEERIAQRRSFLSSVDFAPLSGRRAREELTEEYRQRPRNLDPPSVDAPPIRRAAAQREEQEPEAPRRTVAFPQTLAAQVDQPPLRRALRIAEHEPEERILRRFLPPPSGAVAPVDQPPRIMARARTEDQQEERLPGRPSVLQSPTVNAPPGMRAQRRDELETDEPRVRRAVQLQSVDNPPPRRAQPREEPEPDATRVSPARQAQSQVLGQFIPTPRRRAAEDLEEERVPQRARLTPPSVAPPPVNNPPPRTQARPYDELAEERTHMFAQGGAVAHGSIVLPMPPPERRANAPVHSRKAFR